MLDSGVRSTTVSDEHSRRNEWPTCVMLVSGVRSTAVSDEHPARKKLLTCVTLPRVSPAASSVSSSLQSRRKPSANRVLAFEENGVFSRGPCPAASL